MVNIFISYSRKNEAFARRLATSLSLLGADVWIDLEDIPVGIKWSTAIQQGLNESEIMIVIMSPDSMASNNVEDEWQYFLDQRKTIVPVLLKPANIHFQLNRLQRVNFHERDYDAAFEELRTDLTERGFTLERAPEPVTQQTPTPNPLPAALRQPASNQRTLITVGVVVLVAAVILIGGLLIVNGRNNNDVASIPTFTPTDVNPSAEPVSGLGQGTSLAPPLAAARTRDFLTSDALTSDALTNAVPTETLTPPPTDTQAPPTASATTTATETTVPTATPPPTDTESPPRATPSPTPTDTPRPTDTVTPTDTPAPPTATDTLTPTEAPTATDTPRATETRTLQPTPTSTPTATATPAVTVAPPPIRLVFDQASFVMVNDSSRPIDIRSMVFVLQSPNGLSVSFNSSMWIERMNGNNFLSSGACVQLILLGSTLPPRPDYCRARAVWIAVGSSRWFWLSREENAAFEVRQVGDRLATCPINAGECAIYFES